MALFDAALVPALHTLEGKPAAEQEAFFTAALAAPAADATPATKAAHAIFRQAALADVDAAALEAHMRSSGLGEASAAAASQSWATLGEAARHGLLSAATKIHRLVDLDWKFGGMWPGRSVFRAAAPVTAPMHLRNVCVVLSPCSLRE
eukprot:5479781-Prymnesium_polylepis.2